MSSEELLVAFGGGRFNGDIVNTELELRFLVSV